MTSFSKTDRGDRRPSLAVLFSVIVVDLIGFGIVVPILPFWAERFGADGTTLGLLLASHAAMQLLGAPLWGRLSDRIGRRPVMLITIAGTAIALLLLGFAQSLLQLFLARLLSGLFAANISVATAYLTDVTEEADRTKWMGMIGASFAVGFTLGPPLGGLLTRVSDSAPMTFAAALAGLNFVWALLRLQEPAQHARREAGGLTNRLDVLREPGVARRRAHAHPGADCQRPARGSPALHGCGYGRLPHQADPHARPRRGSAQLRRAQARALASAQVPLRSTTVLMVVNRIERSKGRDWFLM